MSRAAIISVGTSTPERSLSMARSVEIARALTPDEVPTSLIERLHDRSGIDARGCAVLDRAGGVPLYGVGGVGGDALQAACANEAGAAAGVAIRPGTAERMRAYEEASASMAVDAARSAMCAGNADPSRITHLVTASCTGFSAPGFDQAVIRELGLPAAVRRTHIGFMGCHAAVNALAVASAFAESVPGAQVLLACSEVCTVHFHASARVDRVVANILFADGAAAALVAAQPADDGGVRGLAAAPSAIRFASTIIPETSHAMAWHVGDHGFEMTLGADVPDRIAAALPRWVDAELAAAGLCRSDVGGWAIHPGGPRVIDSVVASLGLRPKAGDASRAVLRRHGNMSSATILFILEELRRSGAPRPWVALAFGPGLAGEMAILA